MALDPVTAILNVGSQIIDKIFPDKTEAEKAKVELAKAQMNGSLDELKVLLQPFLAETQSSDKWTSRARPSFFYVMYIMILAGIPMGILTVFNPQAAATIATGMKSWLSAIPSDLWYVFGAGFSVYTVARSRWDKQRS
jgi:hypothetical protein